MNLPDTPSDPKKGKLDMDFLWLPQQKPETKPGDFDFMKGLSGNQVENPALVHALTKAMEGITEVLKTKEQSPSFLWKRLYRLCILIALWLPAREGVARITRKTSVKTEVIGPWELFKGSREENLKAQQAAVASLWGTPQALEKFEKSTTEVGVDRTGSVENITTEISHPFYKKRRSRALLEAKFGIPPSITLAQWLLEGWTEMKGPSKHGNQFWMKGGTYNTIMRAWDWLSAYYPHAPASDKQMINDLLKHIQFVKNNFDGFGEYKDDYKWESFVHFKTTDGSFAAHTLLLLFGVKKVASNHPSNVYYQWNYLPMLWMNDYSGRCAWLKLAGYATDPNYHKKMLKLIEDGWLQKLDSSMDWARAKRMGEVIMRYNKRCSDNRKKKK